MKTRGRLLSFGGGVFCVLLCTVLFLLMLPAAAAEEKYMTCDSTEIDIVLDDAGNASVTETRDCYFGGDTITRMRRHYKLNPDYSIAVREVLMDGVPMTLLDRPDDTRPEGCAAVYEQDGLLSVEMYLDALNESHILEIRYDVTDAVILHSDAAEFIWNLTSEKEPCPIAAVDAVIEIPYGTKDRGLYFFGHGPAENGYFEARPEDGMVNLFELHAENVTVETPVYVHFAMPLELFPNGTNISGEEGLPRIFEEEHYIPPEHPEEPYDTYHAYGSGTSDPLSGPHSTGDSGIFGGLRAWMEHVHPVWRILALLAGVLPLVLYLLLTRPLQMIVNRIILPPKYRELRKTPAEAPQYYRLLPDDMKPAMVYRLSRIYPLDDDLKQRLKSGNAFSATILSLIETGILQMEKMPDDQISYRLRPDAAQADLTEYEQTVVDIFREAGAEEAFRTTEEIKSYMHKNYHWCKEKYHAFQKGTEQAFDAMEIYTEYPGREMKTPVLLLTGGIFGLFIFLGLYPDLGIPGAAVSGALLAFVNAFFVVSGLYETLHPAVRILTQDGENRYALWMAYARYLNDFTTFEEREVPDIRIWRKYLVYAAALGCSETMMEQLRVHFPEVYRELSVRDPYFAHFDELSDSVTEIDREGSYTIRSDSSGGGSGSSDGYGGISGGGGSSDSGSGGGDFD